MSFVLRQEWSSEFINCCLGSPKLGIIGYQTNDPFGFVVVCVGEREGSAVVCRGKNIFDRGSGEGWTQSIAWRKIWSPVKLLVFQLPNPAVKGFFIPLPPWKSSHEMCIEVIKLIYLADLRGLWLGHWWWLWEEEVLFWSIPKIASFPLCLFSLAWEKPLHQIGDPKIT